MEIGDIVMITEKSERNSLNIGDTVEIVDQVCNKNVLEVRSPYSNTSHWVTSKEVKPVHGINKECPTVVDSIIDIIIGQQEKGLKKYGMTVDDAELSEKDWIKHTQEELADALIYLEKLKNKTLRRSEDCTIELISERGMFSAEQMEDAYRDGYENEYPKLWDFDIENYR